ncbi:MAG: histidine phosphatase family protein [Betaproteobacteria bacterium]|nr:histidine phosphatase family protein [Betaproteobacteria bacterium]
MEAFYLLMFKGYQIGIERFLGAIRLISLIACLSVLNGPGLGVALAAPEPPRTSDVGAAERVFLNALAQPSTLVLVRHAQTVPGIGDPPGFRLEDCATQRNLSLEGQQQARAMGAWFARHGIVFSRVRSSQWCRCLDTAAEAFGRSRVEPHPDLNSFFQGHGNRQRQILGLKRAGEMPGRGLEIWVTHQVTIGALSGQGVGMGEMLAVRAQPGGDWQVIARLTVLP